MWPLGACRLTWLLYWKAGCSLLSTGSCTTQYSPVQQWCTALTWPTTPRPRTVSSVPDSENIRQFRSRNCTPQVWVVVWSDLHTCTDPSPRFSSLMQYRHQYTLFCALSPCPCL